MIKGAIVLLIMVPLIWISYKSTLRNGTGRWAAPLMIVLAVYVGFPLWAILSAIVFAR